MHIKHNSSHSTFALNSFLLFSGSTWHTSPGMVSIFTSFRLAFAYWVRSFILAVRATYDICKLRWHRRLCHQSLVPIPFPLTPHSQHFGHINVRIFALLCEWIYFIYLLWFLWGGLLFVVGESRDKNRHMRYGTKLSRLHARAWNRPVKKERSQMTCFSKRRIIFVRERIRFAEASPHMSAGDNQCMDLS